MESCQPPQNSQLWEILLLMFATSVDEGAGQSIRCPGTVVRLCINRFADAGTDGTWLRNALCLFSLFPLCLLSVDAQTRSCSKSLVNQSQQAFRAGRALSDPFLLPHVTLEI